MTSALMVKAPENFGSKTGVIQVVDIYIYIPSYTNHGSGWHGPWKDRVPLQSGGELHFHVSESECISYSNPMGSVLVLSNSGDLPPTEAPNHSNHSNHKPSQ